MYGLTAKATKISCAKFHCNRLELKLYKIFKITRVSFFGTLFSPQCWVVGMVRSECIGHERNSL